MILSRITTEAGREYVPAIITDDCPQTVYGKPVIILMKSGGVLVESAWTAGGYRLEACSGYELPEVELLPWVDVRDLSVAITSDGVRYVRAGALDLFSSEVPR